MTTLLAFVFAFFAFSYLKSAIDPSGLSRLRVQLMCATLGALSFLVSATLFLGGAAGG